MKFNVGLTRLTMIQPPRWTIWRRQHLQNEMKQIRQSLMDIVPIYKFTYLPTHKLTEVADWNTNMDQRFQKYGYKRVLPYCIIAHNRYCKYQPDCGQYNKIRLLLDAQSWRTIGSGDGTPIGHWHSSSKTTTQNVGLTYWKRCPRLLLSELIYA